MFYLLLIVCVCVCVCVFVCVYVCVSVCLFLVWSGFWLVKRRTSLWVLWEWQYYADMKIVGADIQSPDVFSPINKGIICVGCCYFITCAGMFCAHSSLFPLLFLTPNYCIPGFKQSTAMETVSQGNHPPTYLLVFFFAHKWVRRVDFVPLPLQAVFVVPAALEAACWWGWWATGCSKKTTVFNQAVVATKIDTL